MPFPPTPTSVTSTHSGTGHCGTIRFTFSLSPPLQDYSTDSCNCSICTKNGYLFVYPFTKDFTLRSGGEEKLRTYMFGRRRSEHRFCGVRMLDDFEYDKLKRNFVDGRADGPEYKV